MKTSGKGILIAVLLNLVICPCTSMAEESLLERAMSGAEYSIMTSLIVHRNKKSRYLCATTKYACVGADRAELGVSLIGATRHRSAPRRLLGLVRFGMDAGLSADYKCYINENKNGILDELKSVSPRVLRKQCVGEFNKFIMKTKKEDYEIGVNQICRTEAQIFRELKDIETIARMDRDEDCM